MILEGMYIWKNKLDLFFLSEYIYLHFFLTKKSPNKKQLKPVMLFLASLTQLYATHPLITYLLNNKQSNPVYWKPNEPNSVFVISFYNKWIENQFES